MLKKILVLVILAISVFNMGCGNSQDNIYNTALDNKNGIGQKVKDNTADEQHKQIKKTVETKKVEIDNYGEPLSDYSIVKDNITTQNYNIMYKQDAMTYMLSTTGKGSPKKVYIVDSYDIEELRKGTMNDADLNQRAMTCTNYKFGNVLHILYSDGDARFVVICNPNVQSLTVYGKLKNDKEYSSREQFVFVGIQ